MFTGFRVMIVLSCMSLCLPSALAESGDEYDFELDFGIKQKSTIENFPLQEVGQDTLSDAAIAGALRSTNAGNADQSGKPAYAEQNEVSEKQKKSELDLDREKVRLEDLVQTIPSLPPSVQFDQQPFSMPNGRMVNNNNSAFERP